MTDFKTIETNNVKCSKEEVSFADLKNRIKNSKYRPLYTGVIAKTDSQFKYYFFDEDSQSFFPVIARPEQISNLLCEALPKGPQTSSIIIDGDRIQLKNINLTELDFLFELIGEKNFYVDPSKNIRIFTNIGTKLSSKGNSERIDSSEVISIIENIRALKENINQKGNNDKYGLIKNIYDYYYDVAAYCDLKTYCLPGTEIYVSQMLNTTPCSHPSSYAGLIGTHHYASSAGIAAGLVEVLRYYGIDACLACDNSHHSVKINMEDGTFTYIDLSKAISEELKDTLYRRSSRLDVKVEERPEALPKGDKNKYFLGLDSTYETHYDFEKKNEKVETESISDNLGMVKVVSEEPAKKSPEVSVNPQTFQEKYKAIISNLNKTIKELATSEDYIAKLQVFLINNITLGNESIINELVKANSNSESLESDIKALKDSLSKLESEEYRKNPIYYVKTDPELKNVNIDYMPLLSDSFTNFYMAQISLLQRTSAAMTPEMFSIVEKVIKQVIDRRVIREIQLNPDFDVTEFLAKKQIFMNQLQKANVESYQGPSFPR